MKIKLFQKIIPILAQYERKLLLFYQVWQNTIDKDLEYQTVYWIHL